MLDRLLTDKQPTHKGLLAPTKGMCPLSAISVVTRSGDAPAYLFDC